MSPHVPPKDFPTHHFAGLAIPADLARVISEAATKNGVLFADQMLTWTQLGAECARRHQSKE